LDLELQFPKQNLEDLMANQGQRDKKKLIGQKKIIFLFYVFFFFDPQSIIPSFQPLLFF
jgi:hypothetical protein